MKSIIFRILVFISLFSSLHIEAQERDIKKSDSVTDSSKAEKVKLIIRNPAALTFELSTFYNYGVYELSGNYNGDFDPAGFIKGENFGVRHGFGGMLTAKIPLHNRGNLRANISISYNLFSSKLNKSLNTTAEPDFMKYNVYSCIVGVENNFTPSFKIKTYAGAGFIASIISGEGRITDKMTVRNISILPAFRLGLSVNSGMEIMMSNSIGLNCGIRFTHANLWLKESKVSDNQNEIYLNDNRTATNQPYAGFKQFTWGSFFAGINYFFGITQKEYIYKNR